MVAQNCDKLNTVSSLTVNGDHTLPPHLMAWSSVQPFGGWNHQASISPMWTERRTVAQSRETGRFQWDDGPGQHRFLAVRLLRPSLTRTTARSRIFKERVDQQRPGTSRVSPGTSRRVGSLSPGLIMVKRVVGGGSEINRSTRKTTEVNN